MGPDKHQALKDSGEKEIFISIEEIMKNQQLLENMVHFQKAGRTVKGFSYFESEPNFRIWHFGEINPGPDEV